MAEATVYATAGGQRYHAAVDCPRLLGGRDFWDGDECSPYPIREETAEHAAMRGRTPCLACRPPLVQVPLYGQTFGHVPEPIYVDGPEMQCAIDTRRWNGEPIPWPCLTAVLLVLPAA